MQPLPVKIAIKVEHHHFQQRIPLARGRRPPEIRDPRAPGRLPVLPRPDRIDPVRRMHDFAQLHVGRRKAQRPPALLAMLDDPVENPRPAQRLSRRRHVAPLDRLAHPRRRHLHAVAFDFGDDLHLEAKLRPDPLQPVDIPHPPLAEAKVEPDANRRCANLIHDHALAEFAICHRRHHGIEPQQVNLGHAQCIQRNLAPPRRHQSERRRIRLEKPARRRLERCDAQLHAQPARGLARTLDHRAMSCVQPVEIAKRDCWAFSQVTRPCRTAPSQGHRPSCRSCRQPRPSRPGARDGRARSSRSPRPSTPPCRRSGPAARISGSAP